MHSFKIVSAIALLLIVLVGAGIYTQSTLSSTAQHLESQIAEVERNTIAEDWDKAGNSLERVEKDWGKTEKTWTTLIDHTEIDNIDYTLSKLSKYVETESKSLALAEIAALKKYIQHIPEKESFLLKNIF